jgi:hypothetical protein
MANSQYKSCWWVGGIVSWEKQNFDAAGKCGGLQIGSTLMNEEQDFVIFITQFSKQLCEVPLKYFGHHPRICISFMFHR